MENDKWEVIMEYPLYNQKAENIGTVELPDSIFGLKSNNDLLHQVVVSQRANKRQVLAHAKTRSEVRGGGKKPWRQKGTGRARHGSIRSPIWKGGGATFGPTKFANFKKNINKKMLQKAVLVALSEKARNKNIIMVDDISLNVPKTKEVAGVLKSFRASFEGLGSVLIISPSTNKDLYRAAKNMKGLAIIEAKNISPLLLLSYKNLLILKDAVNFINKSGK